MDTKIYNSAFHNNREKITRYSAKTILELLHTFYSPQSCVDVGGGIGVWIDEFVKIHGENCVADCLDGDYITSDMLVIDSNRFFKCDLTKEIKSRRGNKYDLAISLEVAEHLPKARAESFVNDLVELSDVVLFSGAIPGQGGEGHINEQFMSYWVELFNRKQYLPIDLVRPYIQDDISIPWWYRQNIILFVNGNSNLYSELKQICVPPLIHFVLEDHYKYIYNAFTSVENESLLVYLKRRIKNSKH